MNFGNTSYLTTLDKWQFGDIVKVGKKILEQKTDSILESDYFIMLRAKANKLDIRQFDIGSKFIEEISDAHLKSGEHLEIGIEGDIKTKRLMAKYSYGITTSRDHLKIIVPELDMIYIIRDLERDRKFIQWSIFKYNQKNLKIIENTDHLLFQNINSTTKPLAAFISGLDALVMGDTLIGSVGYFKEVEPS